MNTVVNVIEPRLLNVQITEDEIIGDGQGIHWPDIDEDISVSGMLTGSPARRPHKKTTVAA
ncbi:DUF2442 domain-containing protein [Crocosphaera sp. UHCC 0190]|uniref:DUF2442 domain-containing protein n=1 Tax=Crocosphaera sp. UHCC 0190 TaxID=3110246 RepID=UPI002B2020DF|nr:DUF2442 domain-containing protein [Crocosphaera sp. UHCC 0190]MEA5511687.1 DUF2442 domain-containing protein [Crocosphaera sp. UHCC 0190]